MSIYTSNYYYNTWKAYTHLSSKSGHTNFVFCLGIEPQSFFGVVLSGTKYQKQHK